MKTKIDDINTFVYKVIDLEIDYNKDEEELKKDNIKIISKMKYICKNINENISEIAHFGTYIISTTTLNNNIIYNHKEYKLNSIKKISEYKINYKNVYEITLYSYRKLYERLLSVLCSKFFEKKKWKCVDDNTFISDKTYYNINGVDVNDKIRINWYINEKNNIILSFKSSYRIIERENISKKNIDYLSFIVDKTTNKRLQFVKYEDITCGNCLINNGDIETRLIDMLDNNIITNYNINENTKVVNAYYCDSFNSINKKEYYFPVNILHLERNDIRNNSSFTNKFPGNKIIDTIKIIKDMLNENNINFEINGLYLNTHKYNQIHKFQHTNNYNTYTFKGIVKYYIIHSSVIDWNIINNFSDLLKLNNNKEFIMKQEKILSFNNKPTTYLKDIKNINKNTLNNWKNKNEKFIVIIITNNDKDTNSYDEIKTFFGSKNIGTQCISLKLIEKILNDSKKDNYLNNIIPQIAVKSGLNPIFNFTKYLKSKCFIGIDVSHIPKIVQNKTIYNHVSGSISCFINKKDVLSFQDYGNDEKGEKIVKLNENSIDIIIEGIINKYQKEMKTLPDHLVIHRDGFMRNDELNLIKNFFNEYKTIKYTVVCILKNINKKICNWDGCKIVNSNLQYYINKEKNEGYIISSKVYGDKLSNPYKVVIKYNSNKEYTIKDACNDCYYLSFPVHTKGSVKLRLPITIHYSDESSTSRNKGYINKNQDNDKLIHP